MKDSSTFILRRVHSLFGIIPVGFFLLQHLFVNSIAPQGPKAFNAAVGFMQSMPNFYFFEIFYIALPILFHSLYGLWITVKMEPNLARYPHYRNFMYLMQRITGVVIFAFVLFHVYTLPLQKYLGGPEVSFEMLHDQLQNPIFLAIYAIGLVVSVFHFANGIGTFLIKWGITVGPQSQKFGTILTWLLFLGITAWGFGSLMAFYL